MSLSKSTKIGLIGGGQLAMMMAQEIPKFPNRFTLIASDPNPECPASYHLDEIIEGDFKQSSTLHELASHSDILSYEIELASSKVLQEIEASGVKVYPSPKVLEIIQDKYKQSCHFAKLGLPVPRFFAIESKQDLLSGIQEIGLPLMIKARFDSYDGKGNQVLRSLDEIPQLMENFQDTPIMAQEFIPFDEEISVISARSRSGNVVCFPVAQNIHGPDYHILERSIAPAPITKTLSERALSISSKIVQDFQTEGVLAVEFLVNKGQLFINEVAPRVHNTGHYTIEACDYSQFALHLLAGIQEDLPQPEMIVPMAVMQNITGPPDFTGEYDILFGEEEVCDLKQIGSLRFHLYNKSLSKPYRKLGHWTLCSRENQSLEELLEEADSVLEQVQIVPKASR